MGNKIYTKLDNISINNNINKKEDNYIENKNFFLKNPNLRFKRQILKSEEYNYRIFEYYYSIIGNNHNIAIGTKNYNINIIAIENKDNIKLIKILEGHKSQITEIKYFKDINNILHREYLLSAENKFLFIRDIIDNYNIIYKINLKYSKSTEVISCLMLFNISNSNYIISSSFQIIAKQNNMKDFTKIFLFNNKSVKHIRNVQNSNKYQTFYLLSWYNKNDNNYYLIECCKEKMVINNLLTNYKYGELNSFFVEDKKVNFNYAFIYEEKGSDYIICSLSIGIISIWNLENKKLINIVNLKDCWPGVILRWNKIYIIVADKHQKSLKIISLDNLRLINNIIYKKKTINCEGYNYIIKVEYPKEGESILALSLEEIELWSAI